jgi:hypothetical protein
MKNTLLWSIVLVALLAVGCKDATRAQFSALGKKHHIVQFSGGKIVGEWTSTGNVNNQTQSDGWYFEDVATHGLVEVSGTLQITVIP